VPDKIYIREYTEPLTPARLAELLPPLPVPQLELLNGADPGFKTPLQMLTAIEWAGGVPEDNTRPPTVTMKGTCAVGSIDLTVNIQTRRFLRLTAAIKRGASEGTFDLGFKAIDPGEPAKWAISQESRQKVNSLSDLRLSARSFPPVEPGQPAPNINLSRFDMSAWLLNGVIDVADPRQPLALLLFHLPAAADAADAVQKDAKAGLAALHQVQRPGPNEPPAPQLNSAAAVVMELGDFTHDRWEQARRQWGGFESAIGADDLMWSSAASQSIDRFNSTAGALIAVVRADHTLAAVISLDGRANQIAAIAADIRKALESPKP
jgi:hypothetical protein